jgi:hypothetical protein
VSCAATACAACLVTCPAARTHLLHALLLPEPLVSLRVQPFMLASSIRCYACRTARAHLFCVRHAVRRAPHAWLLSMCLASLYVCHSAHRASRHSRPSPICVPHHTLLTSCPPPSRSPHHTRVTTTGPRNLSLILDTTYLLYPSGIVSL